MKRLLLLPLLLAVTPLNAEAFESRGVINANCLKLIRSLLTYPRSYRFDGFEVIENRGNGYGIAYVKYAARNRFGGMQIYGARCAAYPRNGRKWWRVRLMQS